MVHLVLYGCDVFFLPSFYYDRPIPNVSVVTLQLFVAFGRCSMRTNNAKSSKISSQKKRNKTSLTSPFHKPTSEAQNITNFHTMFSHMMINVCNNGNGNDSPLPQQPPPSVRVLPRNTHGLGYNPIVTAMLTGNTLQSCEAIEALLGECYGSNSDARICQAASMQFARCIKMEEQHE